MDSSGRRLGDILDSILARSWLGDDGLHYISVVYLDKTDVAGWLTRRFSGVQAVATLPHDSIRAFLKHELQAGLHRSLMGKSVFSFPKLIKYICRCE